MSRADDVFGVAFLIGAAGLWAAMAMLWRTKRIPRLGHTWTPRMRRDFAVAGGLIGAGAAVRGIGFLEASLPLKLASTVVNMAGLIVLLTVSLRSKRGERERR